MKFKNELEEQAFLIAQKVYGDTATIDHNKVIQIENAIFPEVFSFTGPPKKEIDVLTTELRKEPKISLLVSCKYFDGKKAEPAHVQEWASVLHTMSKYSKETIYLGLILCPTGFTSGCESWVTSSNIAVIPPIKGKGINFPTSTSLQMFERTLIALKKRVLLPFEELLKPPEFYDFVYRITSDFEGFEETTTSFHGERYFLAETGWRSSFGELVTTLIGKEISNILSDSEYTGIIFKDDYVFKYFGDRIVFGKEENIDTEIKIIPSCRTFLSGESCSFDEIEAKVKNKKITSAADFGNYFELGIDNYINLGFHPSNLLVIMEFDKDS